MTAKTRKRFFFAAALAAACLAAFASAKRVAAMISGGSFVVSTTAIVAGGSESTGAAKHNISAIGGNVTAMSGGTFSLIGGALASVPMARSDTSAAHAYPTPFIPSQGHDRITFTELPVQTTIKVYTISGRLVKTLEKNDTTDSFVWMPVANEQGTALASGVYVFVATQPGVAHKQGKIMVIK